MRTIAVVNQKGGVGKTTTAVNLAAALAEKGRSILLVDLDAQRSASSWYGVTNPDKSILDVFTDKGNVSDVISKTDIAGVDLVPADAMLAGMDRYLAGEIGADTILQRQLRRLPADRWHYLLIDCPPTLGILTVNALAAAREVLVPVEANVMALAGLAQLIQTVERAKERVNPDLAITGIVACRVDSRTRHSQEVMERLKGRFGNVVYNTYIRNNVRIAEAPSFAQPITLYDTRSAGAADYRSLADEVIRQEGTL